jgi:hypothetical protein
MSAVNDSPDNSSEWIMKLIITVIVLLMSWISSLPDWKREMLINEVKSRITPVFSDGLSLEHREILEKFRQEMSAWEHKQRRENAS